MPLFYFHVHDGAGLVEDEEGRELANLETAREEGLKGVRSIVAEGVLHGRLDLNGRLDIVGADGEPLMTISFAEAVGQPD